MKVAGISILLLLVVAACFAYEDENERNCVTLEKRCQKDKPNCCHDLKCKCYDVVTNSKKGANRCWCFQPNIHYVYSHEIKN